MERLLCSRREGSIFIIDGSEFKHLKALRLREGERIEVFCEDKLFLAHISKITNSYALCSVVEELPLLLPKPYVVLYQCIPTELSLMEEVIDRASQSGVFKLVPLFCKRGFHGKAQVQEKMERWYRLSLTSFKQCKRPKSIQIEKPMELADLYPREEASFVLDNFGGSLSIKEIDLSKESYGIVVGPEGGFSQEEVKLLKDRGFVPILLKPYIFRTEMAGAVATAIIMNIANGYA
ncbi:MAG: RsmE family RNA methyltransferase [Aquificaceae bacterium]